MHVGRVHVEVCSVWWTDKTFPKTHWHQTLPVSRLWPQLLPLRPPGPAPEAPHAGLKASAAHHSPVPALLALVCPPSHCLTHFLHVHFHLDSAGLNLWIYIIQNFRMVSSRHSNPPSPYHGSDLKNVNTFFFSGDAKQTLLTDTFNVMRTREHVN